MAEAIIEPTPTEPAPPAEPTGESEEPEEPAEAAEATEPSEPAPAEPAPAEPAPAEPAPAEPEPAEPAPAEPAPAEPAPAEPALAEPAEPEPADPAPPEAEAKPEEEAQVEVKPEVKTFLTLVLDNGTRIGCHPKLGAKGDGQPVMLHYKEGFEKNVVTEVDVDRLSKVLARLDACKRKLDQVQVQPVTQTVVAAMPVAAPVAPAAHKKPKTQPAANSNAGEKRTWVTKCLDIMKKLGNKQENFFFKYPAHVGSTPEWYQNYRKFISHPMDLQTVETKLREGKYATPADFAADMDLIWSNSKRYNKPEEQAGKQGLIMEKAWMRQWEFSGLSGQPVESQGAARIRRNTAGQARAKWEPPVEQPSDSKRSWGKAKSPATAKPRAEVVSSVREARGQMDGERLKQLGSALEEMDENAMEGILDIVRAAGQFEGAEEDEIELDLENLSPEALWKLDDYAKQVTGGRYNPDAALGYAAPVHRGPVVEGDSDDETDDD